MADRTIRAYDRGIEEADPAAVRAFDRELGGLGGRVGRRDPAVHWYRLRYWDYTRKLRDLPLYSRPLRRFHFDFVDNPSLNAVAAGRDGVSLVACFRGAIESITFFFTALLSDPRVLPEVGDPRRERRWIRSLERCDWSTSLPAILASMDLQEPPPRDFPLDPERKLFAHRLAILAMDFLFFHEIGHLANGHVELAQGGSGFGGLEEAAFNPRSSLEPLDYQALEFNADSHAVLVMTRDWLGAPRTLPGGATFATAAEAIDSLVLAMLSLFILFDRKASSVSRYREARHPHPAVRLTNVHHGTFQLAQGSSPRSLEGIKAAWNRGFEQAQQMCSTLEVGASVWHAAEHEMRAIEESYQRIARRFTEIDRHLRPDLDRG